MHDPVPKVGRWLGRVVQGYFNYFSVPGNLHRLCSFRYEVCRAWRRMLQRRSQRHNQSWERFGNLEKRFIPPFRNAHPYPEVRFRVKHPRQELCAVVPLAGICAGGAEGGLCPYRDHSDPQRSPDKMFSGRWRRAMKSRKRSLSICTTHVEAKVRTTAVCSRWPRSKVLPYPAIAGPQTSSSRGHLSILPGMPKLSYENARGNHIVTVVPTPISLVSSSEPP